jgi:TonB family protein
MFCSAVVCADEWSLPTRATYRSNNGLWQVVVKPKQLESQLAYFAGKVAHDENPGATGSLLTNYAQATLYRRGRLRTWKRISHWRLENEVSPVDALVANDGTVVTFDNWHMMGYGDNVVVIYRSDGTLVRKLGLPDLMDEADIPELRRSVSSIWWSGTHRIDEARRTVVLQVRARQVEELPVSLDSGALLFQKHALFPAPTVNWTAEDALATDCSTARALQGAEVVKRLVSGSVPSYPTIAHKARIGGSVLIVAMIDASGNVTAVTFLKSLPFGLGQATIDVVSKWRFRPLDDSDSRMVTCARIRMSFDLNR